MDVARQSTTTIASKARITRFEVMEPTLEEIFIETVGDRVDA